MITSIIKKILADSGCTLVIYEQPQLANLYTDQSNCLDYVGVIMQPNSVDLEVKGNAIHEHYNPLTIDIITQVELEDKAEVNETKLQKTLNICKRIIERLINEAVFKTITPVTVNKILETKYDANAIGWTMNLNLYYLANENKDVCRHEIV
jgi:hypothetical protein